MAVNPYFMPLEGQMTDDTELKDALRKFMSAWLGEGEIERLVTRPDGMVDAWDDSRRVPPGPKTREQVLDFLSGLSTGGLTQFFRQYHAAHGKYPEFSEMFPPGGPVIGKLEDMD